MDNYEQLLLLTNGFGHGLLFFTLVLIYWRQR